MTTIIIREHKNSTITHKLFEAAIVYNTGEESTCETNFDHTFIINDRKFGYVKSFAANMDDAIESLTDLITLAYTDWFIDVEVTIGTNYALIDSLSSLLELNKPAKKYGRTTTV